LEKFMLEISHSSLFHVAGDASVSCKQGTTSPNSEIKHLPFAPLSSRTNGLH